MVSWLLTWNPDKFNWDNYDEECEEASEKSPILDSWSCWSKKTQAGDEFYLIKLGKPPRGIIAHGIIIGDRFEADHWDYDRAEKTTNYVDVECYTILNYKTQAILDVSVLDEKLPQQYWHPQASGTRIKDEVVPVLRELWAAVTGAYPKNPEESTYYDCSSGSTIEGARKTVYTTTHMNVIPKLGALSCGENISSVKSAGLISKRYMVS